GVAAVGGDPGGDRPGPGGAGVGQIGGGGGGAHTGGGADSRWRRPVAEAAGGGRSAAGAGAPLLHHTHRPLHPPLLRHTPVWDDRITTRVLDPLRVVVVGGHGYLEAWCRTAGQVRRFRADRIDALRMLAEPAAPPPQARPRPIERGIFQPDAALPLVTLRVGRSARWIAEYYPCEQVDDSGPDWVVSLRVTDLDWARRLVLRLGPEVTVLAPVELAEAVRAEAAAALEAYATPVGLAAAAAAAD